MNYLGRKDHPDYGTFSIPMTLSRSLIRPRTTNFKRRSRKRFVIKRPQTSSILHKSFDAAIWTNPQIEKPKRRRRKRKKNLSSKSGIQYYLK